MLSKSKLQVAIEYDDASPKHPIGPRMFELLQKFRDHYPGYKVTLFTVPWEIRFGKPLNLLQDDAKNWVAAAKEASDQGWMFFALHGLTHIGPNEQSPYTPPEFSELDYETAKKRIQAGKDIFEKAALPLLPIFKAPHWAVSQEAKQAAEDVGFTVVEDKYYHWNLRDPLPKTAKGTIIAHGHVQDGDGCFNGIDETKDHIFQLPTDTVFLNLQEAL